MLVITRKPKESLWIGKDVSITILDIRSDQVKVGVEAPLEVRVVRGELLGEICQRNRSAARLFPNQLEGIKWGLSAPGATTTNKNRPDVYLETETEDLEVACATYRELGFAVRERNPDNAWLERSGMWLRCTLNLLPCRELRLGFSATANAAT